MNLVKATHYIDGREIKIGVHIPRLLQSSRFDFSIVNECVSENPFSWRATVSFGRAELFTTAEYADPEQAGAAAEAELESRFARMLGDSHTR